MSYWRARHQVIVALQTTSCATVATRPQPYRSWCLLKLNLLNAVRSCHVIRLGAGPTPDVTQSSPAVDRNRLAPFIILPAGMVVDLRRQLRNGDVTFNDCRQNAVSSPRDCRETRGYYPVPHLSWWPSGAIAFDAIPSHIRRGKTHQFGRNLEIAARRTACCSFGVCCSWWRPIRGIGLVPKDTLWARPRPSRPKPSSGSDRPQMLVGISSIGCTNKLITPSMGAMVPGLCLQNVRGHRAELCARTYASTASGPPDLVATLSPLHLAQTKLNVRKRGGSWTMTRPK